MYFHSTEIAASNKTLTCYLTTRGVIYQNSCRYGSIPIMGQPSADIRGQNNPTENNYVHVENCCNFIPLPYTLVFQTVII